MEEQDEREYTLVLKAIHEDLCEQDIKNQLKGVGIYGEDWEFTYFIPLQECYMAEIKCTKKETLERIRVLCKDYISGEKSPYVKKGGKRRGKKGVAARNRGVPTPIRREKEEKRDEVAAEIQFDGEETRSCTEGEGADDRAEGNTVSRADRAASEVNFLELPQECLEYILKKCPLREQLQLARTCRTFYHLLQRKWKKQFVFFNYSLLELKYVRGWTEEDIRNACVLFGKYVRILRFCTLFRTDMLMEIQRYDGWNPIERLKKHFNLSFISNLKYFENAEEFEIQGKLVTDFVIEAFAYKCKRLRCLRFLNGTTQSCCGTFLHKLRNLEHLEIPSSRNISAASLMMCCRENKIYYLNITECKLMEEPTFIIKLCKYWEHLHTIKLSAFTLAVEYLTAILDLETIKDLQLFAIRNTFEEIEGNIFRRIQAHKSKCSQLKSILFEKDRYSITECSVEEFSMYTYAQLRERSSIYSRPWVWNADYFDTMTPMLKSFINLQEVHFKYARIISNTLLYRIPAISGQVRLISIEGCPLPGDKDFVEKWKKDHDMCRLEISSILDWEEVEKIRTSFTKTIQRTPDLAICSIRFIFT